MSAARAAAGDEHLALFERICTQTAGAEALGAPPAAHLPDSMPSGAAERPGWYALPWQVFDNLYWVGQTRYSAWAVTTPEGIVVIDPLFDYSVEAAVVGGLTDLKLDPADISYVIVSHAHRDHVGGARYLQERFGARVVMASEDWDLLERTGGDWPKPVRDIEAHDGYEVGRTGIVMYHTPGHTPGTMSSIIPVSDRGQPHVAALWGGTAFNFMGDADEDEWFRAYVASAERFAEIARAAGADVILSNHPQYDGSTTKLPALTEHGQRPELPHPFVVGPESVARYLTVAAECARIGLADG